MTKVFDIKGKEKDETELPDVFNEYYRPDLIKKAVLAHQSKRRQKYGTDQRAGLKSSAHYEGLRGLRPGVEMMRHEMSRMPREHGDTARQMRARKVPQATGGRKAHPPKADKDFEKEINKKEKQKAVRSAISATAKEEPVKERNHKYEGELPLVVEDKIQSLEKTAELKDVLEKIGLDEDLDRARPRKVRAGKGTMRGRKYKTRKSVLIVIEKDQGIKKAANNLPGVNVATVEELNAELLSPGAHGARLTVYSESALEKIGEMI
ncbi:MAG: 50S ribosomal protein L4 [Candidatus Aenigmatarchaeota archaeon]